MNETRVGIVGAGPMGRLHARTVARVAKQAGRCRLAAVVDRHRGRARALAREFGGEASSDLDLMFSNVDAVIVSVPTTAHFGLSASLLERGLDLLIEKPLAATLAEGEQLAALAHAGGRIIQVGHVEWYNRGWRDAARLAGKPRSIEVDRLNPSNHRGLELDVVQDFMLHDLDWVTRLLGEEIIDLEAEGRCVVNDRLDEAEARFRFRSGCRVRLRASRVHSERRRVARIEGSESTVTADLLTRTVAGMEPDAETRPDPLEEQWSEFVESVQSRRQPETDGSVGVEALRLVERVRASIEQNTRSSGREDDSALGR